MIKLKSIKPVFTKILVSARKYENDVKEGSLTVITAGTLMEYQQVIAVGNSVRLVKEGDIIKINPKRYAVKKHDDNSIRNDMGLNHVIGYNFPIEKVDGQDFLYLDESDIDFIVEDYEEIEDAPPSKIIVPDNKIIV